MGGSYLDGPYYSRRFAWPEFVGGIFSGVIIACVMLLVAERLMQ